MTHSPDELQIRPIEPGDARSLLSFYLSLSDEVHWFYRPFAELSEETMAGHLSGVDSGDAIVLGVVDAGQRILGHGFVTGVRGSSPVFGIGLQQDLHGRGWGRRLMEAVMDEADRLGLPLVTLTVLKTNNRAKALYDSMGFVVKGESSFRAENDSWYMERARPV